MRLSIQRKTSYSLSIFLLINSIWMSFYPTLVNAKYQIIDGKLVTTDKSAEIKTTLNEANWDGALLVEQFSIANVNTSDTPPASDDDANFTDSTRKQLANEVYLKQLLPDYNEAEFTSYLNSLDTYSTNPN
ncbi:hypothetical protein [Paraglaciecola sp. 2405UD69-4]|uniref:hypothetical protein n=1 Tax=Paraglaciecola sp. 2405UD69-4 TaxID=3391836 RepID=UPI0039C95474